MPNSITSSNLSRPISEHRTTAHSSMGRGRMVPHNQDEINLALETFINSLQLQSFFLLGEEDQEQRLAKIDSVQLFNALQDVNRQLAMSRLENHYLTDFLEKNEPKLLAGLQHRRVTLQQDNLSHSRTKETTQSMGSSIGRTRPSTSRSQMTTMSSHTTGSQQKKMGDYKLNYRAKADMAEKTANDVEKRIHEIEKNASREIKLLRGHIEEIRLMEEETQETVQNFKLHFMRDKQDLEFLATATEKQIEKKLRKFVYNWIKNAKALLASMRLKVTALQENCQHLRHELMTKADLSGILTAVDFEKLVIKRSELLTALDEKNVHMSGLKGVTGKASLAMSEEKQIMMNIEAESKQLTSKTSDVIKTIGKLEKEARIVESENERDLNTLNNLKLQLERFEAPSVHQYIVKKEEVMGLEKEEKMLRRKVAILTMKLENTQRKCKHRVE